MKPAALLGLFALVPAAIGVAAPVRASIWMPMCGGDGTVRMVPVEGSGNAPSGQDNPCCAKGCHTGSSRKKLSQQIEPAQ